MISLLRMGIFLLICLTQNLNALTWIDELMLYCPFYPCCRCESVDHEYLCDECECCCPYSIGVEYLFGQIKKSPRIVPLVFTGKFDPNVTPTLKTCKTKIVLGNQSIHDKGRSGFKFSFGYFFGGPCQWDMELNYSFFEKRTHNSSVHSNDFHSDSVSDPSFPNNSYLAIPFFNVTTGKEDSVYIARPDRFSGKAKLKTSNWLQGGEWNFSALVPCTCDFRMLFGLRYWNFNDCLEFTTSSPFKTIPDVFATKDKFKTENSFYGAQLGFQTKYEWYSFSLSLKAKIALGAMDERLNIKGKLLTNDFDNFGEVQKFPGGYFALPTNIGSFDRFKFACIPEINLNLGYQINCFSLNIGYTFLYVSRVLWAENQIDRKINPTQSIAITKSLFADVSGIRRPKGLLKSNDFWVQGLNVGFEFQF